MKTKLNLLSFLLPLFETEMGGGGGSTDTVVSPDSAPAGAADSSSALEASDAGNSTAGSATASDVAEGSQAQPDAALEGVPTVEELEALVQQNVPHAKNVVQLRTAYEALKAEHQPLKTTFEPWRPITERFSDPTEVQTNLELLEALSTPVLNNGQPVLDENQLPVTDASPFISKLAATRPAQATALINAALQAPLVENGVRDTALNWALKDMGIDPNDIEGYKAWKQQGAPVATEAVDLSVIPAKYHEVLKQLPPYIQKDRMDMPEEARNWQLEQDLQTFQNRQAQENWQKAEQAKFESGISEATDKAVDEGFQKGFNQFLQQISSWQPTADANVNKAYHLELASSLVNLLDGRMDFANKQLLEAAGVPYDPEIQQLNESYQRNTALAQRYAAHNQRNGNVHAREFAEAQKAADRDFGRLTQKIDNVSARLIEFKNKVAKAEAGAEEAANLETVPRVNGVPAGSNGSSGVNPDWYKSYVRTG
jgi:hypothetical protein